MGSLEERFRYGGMFCYGLCCVVSTLSFNSLEDDLM